MKKQKLILPLAVICTLLLTSYLMSHAIQIAADKKLQQLSGVVIVIDSGHGGKDAGAQSGKIKEDEINLKIAKKTQKLLEDAGAKVIMTRDGDYDLASDSATNRKKEDMKKRVDIINQEEVDLFISIHLNAYPNTKVKGAQAFYQVGNEVSQTFAKIMQKHLKELTGTNMSSKSGDYYLLNNAAKVGSLIECGFLSNAEDCSFLVQEIYQEKIAKTLCEGIKEYFDFLA